MIITRGRPGSGQQRGYIGHRLRRPTDDGRSAPDSKASTGRLGARSRLVVAPSTSRDKLPPGRRHYAEKHL